MNTKPATNDFWEAQIPRDRGRKFGPEQDIWDSPDGHEDIIDFPGGPGTRVRKARPAVEIPGSEERFREENRMKMVRAPLAVQSSRLCFRAWPRAGPPLP